MSIQSIMERPAQEDYSAQNMLPLALIDPSPFNPREYYDPIKLESLANDIRIHGVLQPILVRPVGDRYEIMAGERRYRACKLAGEDEIPATVKPCSDTIALENAIAENFQRVDLNPIELARGMQMLADRNMTQSQIADRIGKQQSDVSKALGLLRLPADVRDMIAKGFLSATHGHYLCAIIEAPEIIESLSARSMDEKWTTDRLKQAVDQARIELENAKGQQSLAVAPPAPAIVDESPPEDDPRDTVAKATVDGFMGDTPAQTTASPMRAPINTTERRTDTLTTAPSAPPPATTTSPTAPAPSPAAVTSPSPAVTNSTPAAAATPQSGMVSVLIPQALDDWLWDANLTVVQAIELLRRMQTALQAAGRSFDLVKFADSLDEMEAV